MKLSPRINCYMFIVHRVNKMDTLWRYVSAHMFHLQYYSTDFIEIYYMGVY